MQPTRNELILGGQKSGKSRRAQTLAQSWLAVNPAHRAVLLATARADDDEMQKRILRHQHDRQDQVPGLVTVEEPLQLAQALRAHSDVRTLVVVDCLTLWLTNLSWPVPVPGKGDGRRGGQPDAVALATGELLDTLAAVSGPVVLVSNEIGLGVIAMGREVRAFVDALGTLNQQVARASARVTLMAAGLPLVLKDTP